MRIAPPSARTTPPPVVWTIAGSDPSGGAGIQADIRVLHGLGAYPGTILTTLIAQNTRGIQRLEYVAPEWITAQWDALAEDLPPRIIKLGLLGSSPAVARLAELLSTISAEVLCDPVLAASDGTPLLEPAALPILRARLLPRVDLLTPNWPEAEMLLERPIPVGGELEALGALRALGPCAVLLKGGHTRGGESTDWWSDGNQILGFTSPRIQTRAGHGTGCVLSAAIAAARARGLPWPAAIAVGKAYLNQGLRRAPRLGGGAGPLFLGGWPRALRDFPLVFLKSAGIV
ncbi:MAG: bifunctional hydroxymethylpyrimidine kinase/phosphomethylpyrimidine kinase [Candidatus Marinimicrobia bacterium]|nr:bifunctional hydroxymethylpyrimidine kinase/phosphomethylpyrimidine kinase [Candidatus Neomarinimicrobiota bacterium]